MVALDHREDDFVVGLRTPGRFIRPATRHPDACRRCAATSAPRLDPQELRAKGAQARKRWIEAGIEAVDLGRAVLFQKFLLQSHFGLRDGLGRSQALVTREYRASPWGGGPPSFIAINYREKLNY